MKTSAIFVSVDRRWSDPAFWIAVQDAASSPITDRNLLAAVDLTRDNDGSIVSLPVGSSANRETLIRTLVTAGMVTICCVLIGLPFSMVAASVNGWARQLLLGAVLLPLWTSLLVRTAAWYILLQDNGLINSTLEAIGLTSGPIPLIFNRVGVVIAMTHVLLPFMVLPIFSVLIGIPKNLMPAAASLGASPIRSFWLVLLPLALRGVVSGSLLVFMSALGYYITPALIGGAKDQMISAVIAYYATGAANWGMAGALGLVLLLATIILYVVYLETLFRGGAVMKSLTISKVIFGSMVVFFLMAPLIAILPLAFTNSVFLNYPIPSFSLRWFDELFTADAWRRSIFNSLIIGVGTTVLSTVLGTVAALGLRGSRFH